MLSTHGKHEEVVAEIGLFLVHLKYTLQNKTHSTGWKYWAENAAFLPIFASKWTHLRY